MTASSIGKESEIPTQVEVGPRKELLMECKRLREEIGKMDTELEALRKVEKALKQLEKAGNQILASDPRKIKLMRSKILKSMELEETKRKFHAMEEETQNHQSDHVCDRGCICGGCAVKSCPGPCDLYRGFCLRGKAVADMLCRICGCNDISVYRVVHCPE